MSGNGHVICPYCGHTGSHAAECERCRGLFEPLSRQASQNAMGPWYIRDEQNPFRPGCSYATLRMLTLRKRIGLDTILRGPSTRQFWMQARGTPGVAHLLGVCHACGRAVGADDRLCVGCGASFEVEEDRQFLGLAEARPLPGQADAREIARAASTRSVDPSASAVGPDSAFTERAPEANTDPTHDDRARPYEPGRLAQTTRKRRGPSGLIIGLMIASVLGMLLTTVVIIAIALQPAKP